jgi:hypothetical protein
MDSEIIVAIIGAAATLINVAITAIGGQISRRKADKLLTDSEQNKRLGLLETALQCLLRAEIIRSHDKYIKRGYCPIYAKEALDKEYKAYHALGGNDVATDLYRQCMLLPDKPREEQENGQN